MTETTVNQGALDEPVRTLLRLKDYIDARKKAHIAELAPLREARDKLEANLLASLTKIVGDEPTGKIGTFYGTIFKTTKATAALRDPEAFMDYVRENNAYDLLDRKANVTAVRTYIEEHAGEQPPGVNYTATLKLGLHRKAGVNLEN